MKKKLNLVELLKDAPKGMKLYSSICGECELEKVDGSYIFVSDYSARINHPLTFFSDGTYFGTCGECLLFPSKENRDWSTFKVEKEGFEVGDHVKNKETGEVRILTQKAQQPSEGFWTKRLNYPFNSCEVYIGEDKLGEYEKVSKFDPKWLKPFDRVLVRDGDKADWFATSFSHLGDRYYPYIIINGCGYKQCIPYNDETKDLLGTNNEEPDFYKNDL